MEGVVALRYCELLVTYLAVVVAMFLLLTMSGFVAGSETAITGTSKAKTHHLAQNGDKRALVLRRIQDSMSESISAMLVVNHILNFLLSALVTRLSMRCESLLLEYGLSVLTVAIIIIYGEIFPKMLAIYNASGFALVAARPVSILLRVLKPFIGIANFCAKCTMRVVGIDVFNPSKESETEQELLGAIDLYTPEDTEDDMQKRFMLKRILDLEGLPIRNVMTHRNKMWTVNRDMKLEELMKLMARCPYSRVPVWKDSKENIVGILRQKSFHLAVAQGKDPFENLKKPWFVLETTSLIDQMQDFKSKHEHFAMVVDEYGDLLGCVTLEDIIEEIVGEILDEDDVTISDGISEQENGILVDGYVCTRDLNRQFEWKLPEDDAVTIAGVMMRCTGKIPAVGAKCVINGLEIEVVKRTRKHISAVCIREIPSKNEEERDVLS